ncbi:menaquinone biosynthetic enzyme MqnA/MqnD family protein [Chrysiogenes arsenatis]|uniref:menaquinone biosynthetic enzyme MqnA/MqnD family protein n=1 Tax=Chrysiogenes arsenatis TaxID=309797 RepID=UPI000424311E|nr:menaquinone biosynthesis protein [Chrysiogenes arsenatis]
MQPNPRAGIVSYINTAPMVSAILQQMLDVTPWSFHAATPAAIFKGLTTNSYQAGLVSSFAFTQGGAERFVLLPDISISSIGRVQSVLLFHNKPLPKLRTIHLSNSSLTSSNLMRLLMALEGVTCEFIDIAGEESPHEPQALEGLMLIGDQALREVRLGRFAYVSDLAALWYDRFGLPFVFALWVINRSLAEHSPQAVSTLHDVLLQSVAYGRQHLEAIAAQCATTIGYSAAEAAAYLALLSYDLGIEHRQGLELFFSLLERYHIIDHAPPLHFFTPA